MNDILCASPWRAASGRDHINLLETKAYLRVRDQAKAGGDVRYPHVVDYAVTLGAVTKKKTSARTLPTARKQSAALQLSFGLYCAAVFNGTCETRPLDPDLIHRLLANYGRQLYEAGRPYWHYSEMVNVWGPSLRRQLQGAWDLAYSWISVEPYTHHVRMPPVILLALLSVCFMCCWLLKPLCSHFLGVPCLG